jgi:nitroreductase
MDINQIIKQRRSIFPKDFSGGIVNDEIVNQLLENAHWAPSHRSTFAWKFRVFKGESKDRLFDYWLSKALPTKYEKINFNRTQTSHVIIISALDKELNPIEEEMASTACAVQNMYLSLVQFPNVGGYWGSGNGIYEPHFADFVGMEENEFCMGYFMIGMVENKRTDANRPNYKDNVEWVK